MRKSRAFFKKVHFSREKSLIFPIKYRGHRISYLDISERSLFQCNVYVGYSFHASDNSQYSHISRGGSTVLFTGPRRNQGKGFYLYSSIPFYNDVYKCKLLPFLELFTQELSYFSLLFYFV